MTVTFDVDSAYRWLIQLYCDSPGLVQVGRLPQWTGRTFTVDRLDQAVQYAGRLDSGQPVGVYWRVTTLSGRPTSGRGGETDSGAIPALWADLDIAGPGHKTDQPLPPDEESARKVIEEAFLPDPSAWIHSGGGLYPIWQLDAPALIDETNIDEIKALSVGWQDVIGAAAQRLGWHYGTGVGDLARVLRLPGSINRKPAMPEPAPCRVIETTTRRYSLANLKDALLDASELLPKPAPAATRIPPASASSTDTISPGDDFERQVDWAQILEPHGWTLSHTTGSERYWCRPGKARRDGHSASTGRANDRDRLYVFSDATEFPQNEPVTKFHAYTLLNHGGDHRAATRELGRLGYGTPLPDRDTPAHAKVTDPPNDDMWAGTNATPERPETAETEVEIAVPALAEVPTYPTDSVPGTLGDLVRAAGGLPAGLVGGAGLAAIASVIAHAELVIEGDWIARPILWIPLIAPRGAGKSPAMDLALQPLRDRDAEAHAEYANRLDDWRSTPPKERGPRPVDPKIFVGDLTLEMLARRLAATDGAATVEADELQMFLSSLGQYKRGPSSDRGRMLSLWTGAPWSYQRVTNDVDLLIPRPVVCIVGGIQPAMQALLGGEEDGLRPRWLPHLASLDLTAQASGTSATRPAAWVRTLDALNCLSRRGRTWRLDETTRRLWQDARRRWKAESAGMESASTSGAATKADVQAARVALTLAEMLDPGKGGAVPRDAMTGAIAIVDYALDGWRSLPEQSSLALSRRTEILDQAVDHLRDWLESHGGKAARSELLKSQVAKVRTSKDLDAVLVRYEETYPGRIEVVKPEGGGRPRTVIHAPMRRNARSRSTVKTGAEGTPGVSSAPKKLPVSPSALPEPPGGTEAQVIALYPADDTMPTGNRRNSTEETPPKEPRQPESLSVGAVCVGCGAEPTGKDGAGDPRCPRCMPLADDIEEWSA